MSLAYYDRERSSLAASFPEIAAATVPFPVACVLIKRLARENAVSILSIEPTSGRRRSVWYPQSRTIKLNVAPNGTVGVRTAIHEFAHALDGKLRPNSARWHDSTFMSIVLDYCRIVQARGLHLSIAAEYAARPAEPDQSEARRAKKIETRKIQIARLERRLKTLTTRLRTARRSLGALERADRRSQAPALSIVKAATP